MREVLTVANPPVETMLKPADAIEISKQVNDEMAELVARVSGPLRRGRGLPADERRG